MPFPATPLPPNVKRNVVIQLRGPRDKKQLKRLNEELKKLAKKHGARFKKPAKRTRG